MRLRVSTEMATPGRDGALSDSLGFATDCYTEIFCRHKGLADRPRYAPDHYLLQSRQRAHAPRGKQLDEPSRAASAPAQDVLRPLSRPQMGEPRGLEMVLFANAHVRRGDAEYTRSLPCYTGSKRFGMASQCGSPCGDIVSLAAWCCAVQIASLMAELREVDRDLKG